MRGERQPFERGRFRKTDYRTPNALSARNSVPTRFLRATRAESKNKGEHAMRRITKCLAVLGAVLTLSAASARAEQPGSAEPVKLSDQDLDQVSGGDGSLLNLNAFLNITLKNIFVTVNVSNVPINAGLAVQANALGTAAQTATVQALQSVTQLQTMPGLQ
jgi:hypothetical protein